MQFKPFTNKAVLAVSSLAYFASSVPLEPSLTQGLILRHNTQMHQVTLCLDNQLYGRCEVFEVPTYLCAKLNVNDVKTYFGGIFNNHVRSFEILDGSYCEFFDFENCADGKGDQADRGYWSSPLQKGSMAVTGPVTVMNVGGKAAWNDKRGSFVCYS